MNFEEASTKEYLLTNGIGGYCSSTISGANTRRYHGLLVASFNPPTDRMVLVSKIEETVIVNGSSFELSSNQYPGVVHPNGYNFIESYACSTEEVTWIFKLVNHRIKKTIEMIEGENTAILTYTNLCNVAFQLQLMPLLVYRDYHGLFYQNDKYDFYTEQLEENYFKVYAQYQTHPLFIKITKGNWVGEKEWYKTIQYKNEELRGFDFEEDVRSVGKALIDLAAGEKVQIIFSTDQIKNTVAKARKNFVKNEDYPVFINDLIKSSRQFVVKRKSTNGSTIMAGYHWFADWGRDTMIALRGISIATGNKSEAESILRTFLSSLNQGMLPNRFPDYTSDEVEYNTIDATLWLFIALHEYHQKFNDEPFVKDAMPQLVDILEWHIKGTRFQIHVTEDGLLYGGEPGYQLTWMDAKVNDFVVTPRIGCPVEINILWYNALCIYNFFSKEILNEPAAYFETLAEKCRHYFNKYFYNDKDYLNDVVIPGAYVDNSIRPNQIYAASLPFSPLIKEKQQKVLECVTENLLTDYGLRTLDAANPDFKPVYEGNAWNRDNAYHQGTVWPFLWGEWAMAYLKLNNFNEEACRYVWEHSKPLQHHFYNEGCAFGIAEIFDGFQPQAGKGCVQQAWSVGMPLAVFLHRDFKWSLIEY